MSSIDLTSYIHVEGGVSLPPPYDFKRNILMKTNEVDQFRKRYKNTGVFITAYRSDSDDLRTGNLYSDLYFDFDKDKKKEVDFFEEVRDDALMAMVYLHVNFDIPYEVPRIYFSGSKGFHIIIDADYLGIEPSSDLNDIFKLIAVDVRDSLPNKSLDVAIYDKVRLFRIVNSIHQGSHLYKIPLTYEELRNLSKEEIKELAKKPRPEFSRQAFPTNPKAKTIINGYRARWELLKEAQRAPIRTGQNLKLDRCPPCIEYLIENGTPDHRNNCSLIIASWYKQCGIDSEECFSLISEWNLKLDPPLDHTELRRCVSQVYERGYDYGCSTIKDFAPCDETICPLKKKKEAPSMEEDNIPVPETPVPDESSEIDSETGEIKMSYSIGGRKPHDYELEMLNTIDRVNQFAWSRDALGGLSWGDKALDEAFNGVELGVIVIAGMPNIGKSAYALRNAWNIACANEDAYVLYFALDDPDIVILPRVVAMAQKIPISVVKYPSRYIEDGQALSAREQGFEDLRSHVDRFKLIDMKHGFSVEQILANVKTHKAKLEAAGEKRRTCVFIDNLYNIGLNNPLKDKQQRLERVSTELKNFCSEQEIPIVVTGELKKLNGLRRPTLEDLKDSIELQYDVSAVIMCYNEVKARGERAEIFHEGIVNGQEVKLPVLEAHVVKNKLGDFDGRLFYYMYPSMSVLEPVQAEAAKYYIAQMQN